MAAVMAKAHVYFSVCETISRGGEQIPLIENSY